MKLSTLSIALGLGLALPQIYGLARPGEFAAAAKKFPRNLPAGVALILLATAWFVWNVNQEGDSDFAAMKKFLIPTFIVIGAATCIYVQDFLAARGLAVVMMLLAKLMLDTGRPHLDQTRWVLVNQTWAYALIIAGIWFTISPWRLRDLLERATATEARVKAGCALRLAFGLFVTALGLTVF
jgi:hypothetical protein